jgi:hypothetical protein
MVASGSNLAALAANDITTSELTAASRADVADFDCIAITHIWI